jgi:flagellin-like protein
MLNIRQKFGKDEGVSPVIGVIIMVALVVILSAIIGVFVLDLSDNIEQNVTAGVNMEETPDGVTVRWDGSGNADKILVNKNGSEVAQLNGIGYSTTVAVSSGDTVSAVGQKGGSSTLIRSETYTQSYGTTNVSGTVSYNPPAEGVTVKALDDSGSVVGQDTTGVNGEFSVPKTGNYTVNGYTVSATVSEGTDIELDSSDMATSDRAVDILMDTDASGYYKVDSLSDLQAMDTATFNNYKLVSDIDASHSSDWYDKTTESTFKFGQATGTTETFSPSNYSSFDSLEITTSGVSRSDLTVTENANSVDVTNNSGGDVSYYVYYNLENPVSMNFTPITNFDSELDGNNKTISNLTIRGDGETQYVGMFYQYDGTTKDLTLTGVDVDGTNRVGAIAGKSESSASITNVSVSGTITGSGSGSAIGGLVGNNSGGSISKSSSSVTINASGNNDVGGLAGQNRNGGAISDSYATGSVTGDENVGGLVGDNAGTSTVSTSYATGSVTGNTSVGGLVGNNSGGSISKSSSSVTINASGNNDVGGLAGQNRNGGAISDSYATGSVTGDENVGGLVGDNAGTSTVSTSYATGSVTGNTSVGGLVGANSASVSGSYWDTESTGQTGSAASGSGSTGLTTSEMQGSSASTNMSAFDFSSIWNTVSGDYPELQ